MRLLSNILLFIGLLGMIPSQAQEIIKLYPTKPSGSEQWNWAEQQNFSKLFNIKSANLVLQLLLLIKG